MSKSKALVLGGLTLWPIAYMVLFMCVMFTQVVLLGFADKPPSGEMPTLIKIIFPLHFLTMLWIFVLVTLYLRHIFKTDAVPQEKKALWAVVIFLGNMVAMPVYWYLYIWKKCPDDGKEHAVPEGQDLPSGDCGR